MSNSTEEAINEAMNNKIDSQKMDIYPKMLNSTQNDEIEVEGETYTKWDTQTNWKVEDRIRFLLENLIIDVGVQVTDDYKEKNGLYEGMSIENAKSRDKYTILFAELLADARREVIEKVEGMKDKSIEYWMKKLGVPVSDYAYGHKKGYELAIDDVLATLREEESK